jgi:hypothetical protein
MPVPVERDLVHSDWYRENALVLTGVANFRGRQLLPRLFPKLSFPEYAWMGGLPTIRSYVNKGKPDVRAELIASLPRPHFEFLSRCESYFETNDSVASHAGVNPACRESRELTEIVLA